MGKKSPGGYYSVQEIADYFDVSRKTIYRWIYAGKLRAKKFGQEYRIAQEELVRFEKDEG